MFRILDNHIVYIRHVSGDHTNSIRIGTGDHTQATVGNVFDDIVIQNNGNLQGSRQPIRFFPPDIFGNSSTTANFPFDNTQVSNNTIYYKQ